jgi:flagellar protein FlaG
MEPGRIPSLPQLSANESKPRADASPVPAASTEAARPGNERRAVEASRVVAQSERLGREAERIEEDAEVSRESIEALVDRISEQINIERRSLSFQVDDDYGRTIVSVIDLETEEVVRQIPSEEVVRLAKAIREINDQRTADSGGIEGTGLLIREQA